MGNRSKLAVAAASAAAAAAAVARGRRRRAARGIQTALVPTHTMDLPTEAGPSADVGHAPGHRHLEPPAAVAAPICPVVPEPPAPRGRT
jgi:hypothetical protein